ncbi:cytochrome b [Uliginosibacterium sp. H1]|uniref:cytochrome b n=1 Tax=Uliginosibacterium sp. H1 TaxID=3114757 RepID=UPI002E19C059|nr:cytochrome b/b6 domain-containing protein [Uliginosibacterium sp. H1]
MTFVRHHPAIRVVHWLVAGMIIAALAMSTLIMSHIPNTDPAKASALLRHMSVGALIFMFSLLRLYIRRNVRRPPALSSGMAWADRIARVAHRLLDLLVFVMIGSGIGMAVVADLPAVLQGHGNLAVLDQLALRTVHVCAAWLLIGVLALHACGALYHQFVLKDGLLSRMWFAFDREPRD